METDSLKWIHFVLPFSCSFHFHPICVLLRCQQTRARTHTFTAFRVVSQIFIHLAQLQFTFYARVSALERVRERKCAWFFAQTLRCWECYYYCCCFIALFLFFLGLFKWIKLNKKSIWIYIYIRLCAKKDAIERSRIWARTRVKTEHAYCLMEEPCN